MKVVSGSLGHGRGGGGRGRGGGRGGRGGGRGGSSDNNAPNDKKYSNDSRFSSRFSDPRFSNEVSQASRPRQQYNQRAPDDRFTKHLPPPAQEEEEEDSGSDEAEEDGEDEEEDVEVDEEVPYEDEELKALDDEAAAWSASDVEECEAHKRVAIVNCDWDHIRAVDLFAILFHSLPLGGRLHDVSIYMSDLGKKMIAYEKERGPDLWVRKGDEGYDKVAEEAAALVAAAKEEVAMDNGEDGGNDDGWENDDIAMIEEEGADGEKFSSGRYRKYEKDRMKYFYGVATFDTAETAAYVYDKLDGLDIEASGVVMDLRYIDDDETFDAPTSRAERVPPNFKPLTAFKSAALTQSRFKISWDQDDVFRNHSMRDAFVDNTKEDDLAAYIAPGDDDSDDEEAGNNEDAKRKIRKKYAALLAELGDIGEEMPAEDDDDEEGTNSDGSSDDNDLNGSMTFSMDGEEEEDDDDEGMEATIDMGATSKADKLQNEAKARKALLEADVGTKQKLKYKQRRRDMKKTKKQLMEEERSTQKELMSKQMAEEKRQLRDVLGDAVEADRQVLSGKLRRKLHSQQTKAKIQTDRAEQKRQRLATSLGLSASALAQQPSSSKGASKVAAPVELDDRFKSKLLQDPRYHLDVAQRDKKTKSQVQALAAQVGKERQKKSKPSTAAAPAEKEVARRSRAEADEAADFFLSRPAKKSRSQR